MMMNKNKGETPAPSGASPSKTPLEILTVNVRGMNKYVDVMTTRKGKYRDEAIKRKEERKKEKEDENNPQEEPNVDEQRSYGGKVDTDAFLLWISQNKNKIIVLTECKLKNKDSANVLKECIKITSDDSFWVFCNFLEGNASAGVTTLIPKKSFHKPEHKILEKGMVTESTLHFKSRERNEIVLISYYNTNVSVKKDLSKIILEQKVSHLPKVIIAGDFNQMLDSEIDYENENVESLKPETLEIKEKKSRKFKQLVEECNLFYTRGEEKIFTFERNSTNSTYKSRIDWIFFSKYFNHKENKITSKTPTFSTDHLVVTQTLHIPERIEKEKNNGRIFTIPDKYFEDPTFVNQLVANIKKEKLRKKICTIHEKLVNWINVAIRTAKDHKKKKDEEKRKKMKSLHNKLQKKKEKEKKEKGKKKDGNRSEVSKEEKEKEEKEEKEMRKEIKDILWKEFQVENGKKRVIFEKIKGANKIYSKYHRRKTQIKSKVDFLVNDKGEKFFGQDAAKHSQEVFKNIVKDEPIDLEKISNLSHGPKFDNQTKDILNKKFTVKEIREAIKMTPNKEPGPSGIRITLFKKLIDHFAPLLTEIANEALLCGKTGDFLMQGTITLIPKKENSQNVNDLRPITLLEIPRKIITKAMTERIKICLSKKNIISENQFCHPGRLIHDNMILSTC